MAEPSGPECTDNQHVVMLVNNPCVNDSRVIKSAEAVVQTGRRVTVICRQSGDLPMEEERAGVRYLRIRPVPKDWTSLRQRLQTVSASAGRTVTPARVLLFPVAGLMGLLLVGLRTTRTAGRKALRPLARGVKAAKRFAVSRSKGVLRSVYRLFQTEEFSSTAEPYVRELSPDIIHAHDLATLPLGGRLAKALGARLIYDSHELEMHRNATYPRPVKWRRRLLESKYIRQADRVITVSESIADHLRDDYKIPRPSVVMNAPDFDNTATIERDIRSDLKLGEEVPLAVYVGSVTINRGIEQVVRALAHAPNLHFATVGPRRPATEEAAAAIAVELGVRDRLHFLDSVAPDEVVGYIRTAGVGVLPIQNICLSYYYCMPNKLLESVFAGVPVAVANLLEMRRFVDAHGCGVVMDETDPEDVARAISAVMAERERYILSPSAREQLATGFGWPSQADRLGSVYDELTQPGIYVSDTEGGTG